MHEQVKSAVISQVILWGTMPEKPTCFMETEWPGLFIMLPEKPTCYKETKRSGLFTMLPEKPTCFKLKAHGNMVPGVLPYH